MEKLKALWNSKYRGLIFPGAPFLIAIVAFMVWRACYAPVWAAKPGLIDLEVIPWEVCNASDKQMDALHEVAEAASVCKVTFEQTAICGNTEDSQSHSRFIIRFGADPKRGNSGSKARASTRSFFDVTKIEGYYTARDRGDGNPGEVPVGEITGIDIAFAAKEVDPAIIGHEVMAHGCGYWHAYQAMNSTVYMNLHMLSPNAGIKGMDTRGMTLAQNEYMPELAGFDHTKDKFE